MSRDSLIEQKLNNNNNNNNDEKMIDTNKQPDLVQAQTMIEDDNDDLWDDAKEEQPTSNQDYNLNSTKSYTQPLSSSSSEQQSSLQTTDSDQDLKLHKAVFENDAFRIYEILISYKNGESFINKKDKHGNTALHLACMLGRSKEIITTLLENGAGVDIKNLNRWAPFQEACSYGDREIISLITKRLKDDVYDALNKNKLSESLQKIKNCRLVLNWEFQSWVPFLSRVLPSDVCVITKQDKYLRIDTKMLDFEMLSWKKGDSCLVYSDKFDKKWIIMNNKTKKYQYFEAQNVDKNVDEKVDEFMSTDIIDFELKSTDFQLTRSTCGWIWKADRMEKVGKYNASLYNFTNLFLVTRKRREHLREEDLKRNKIAYKSIVHVFKYGMKPNSKGEENSSQLQELTDDDNFEAETQEADKLVFPHRESLPPPRPTNVTWQEYIESEPGNWPNLGRENKCKVIKTPFKACVAMSEEFPITKNEFLDLLSIVPLKLFKKLKDFIELRLPDGFPLRLDIPVFPFLTARITFEDFAFHEGPVDEALFTIPDDYDEDPNLFPFLGGRRNNKQKSDNGSDTSSS